ncbi:MAG TPA: MarR family transcriptional regulator [Pseudonocardia sp.]|jgi:DNA-binding MarR family transcriptional regulator
MQDSDDQDSDDTRAVAALTRVLVGLAWESAHSAPAGVSFAQFRLLLILTELGRQPSSRVAAALAVNASSVTRLADRLERLGHLARGGDRDNRSVVTLEATATGREVVEQVLRRRGAELDRVLERMAPRQRAHLVDGARAFTAAAVTLPELHSSGHGPL